MFIHVEATLEVEQQPVAWALVEEPLWDSAAGQFESPVEVRFVGQRVGGKVVSAIPPRISVRLMGRLWQASVTATVFGLAHGRSRAFLNANVGGIAAWVRPRRLRIEITDYLQGVLTNLQERLENEPVSPDIQPED
jgi:hypothetical protein